MPKVAREFWIQNKPVSIVTADGDTIKVYQATEIAPENKEHSFFAKEVLDPDPWKQMCEELNKEIAKLASLLDGIKYELSARVYTLTDEEFEDVFWARDILQELNSKFESLKKELG